ncbi:hypothetical protein KPH14_008311, partial [Odynerus spinipes]
MATGEDWRSARNLAEVGVALVVGRIEALGLEVAPRKTEALWFHALRRRPPQSHLM